MFDSSFHGIIKEVGGVSADNFTGENLKSRAFFLSHFHTDHIQGLYHSRLEDALLQNAEVFIYMSEITATIVKAQEFSQSVMTTRIKTLKCDQTDIKLPAHTEWKEEYITINLIPAGHCLSSVMFLFTCYNGTNVLYTGDFRMHQNDVSKFRQLHEKRDEPLVIEKMYVDTTFLDKKYGPEFPSRTKCINDLVEIIKSWMTKGEDFNVALKISGYYTTECIFVELSKRLKLKIWVDEKRYQTYSRIPVLNEIITTNPDSTRLYMRCNLYQNSKFLNLFNVGVKKNLLINISAMVWALGQNSMKMMEVKNPNKINVCFSTHCSRTELRAFVSYLQPKNIEGFPDTFFEEDETTSNNLPKLINCDIVNLGNLETSNCKAQTRKRKNITKEIQTIAGQSIFKRYFSGDL